jgi:hypothetical protein
MVCQERRPDQAVWLVMQRPRGAKHVSDDESSNAPVSTRLRTFVW